MAMRPAGTLSQGFLWLLRDFLPDRRRWQAAAVVGLMLVGGMAELFTLGAIFPLLALMADPATLTSHAKITTLFHDIGFDPSRLSLTLLGIIFCIVALSAAGIRILLAWASQSFVFRVGYDMGVSLYERMLYQ